MSEVKVTSTAKVVLMSLHNSDYVLRSLSGISGGTKIPKSNINVALTELMSHGFIDQVVKDGVVLFFLTVKGRLFIASGGAQEPFDYISSLLKGGNQSFVASPNKGSIFSKLLGEVEEPKKPEKKAEK